MLSQAQESLLVYGRAPSDLVQGVTLQVTGEGDSMGPLTDAMVKRNESRETDIRYPITWHTLGEYLEHYNTHRPHRSLHQRPPACRTPPLSAAPVRPLRRDRLGCLVHEYVQVA